jgi:hypothetical protein
LRTPKLLLLELSVQRRAERARVAELRSNLARLCGVAEEQLGALADEGAQPERVDVTRVLAENLEHVVVDRTLRELDRNLGTVRDVRKLPSELVDALPVQETEGAKVLRYTTLGLGAAL